MNMESYYKNVINKVYDEFHQQIKDESYIVKEFYTYNMISEFVTEYLNNRRIISFDVMVDMYVDDILFRLSELGLPHKSENNYLENA